MIVETGAFSASGQRIPGRSHLPISQADLRESPPDCAESVDGARTALGMVLYLQTPLQDYFAVFLQPPPPRRLTSILQRFEVKPVNEGDDDTFRDGLIQSQQALRTFAFSLCGRDARADDLAQETLLKAWANQEKFQRGTNLTAWLFTILRNQFYTECRKARREIEDADGVHAAALTTPADQEHAAALSSVMHLIDALPAPQRRALLLVGAEGFTYEQAAVELDCQVGTVKSRVSRARTFLADTLGRG